MITKRLACVVAALAALPAMAQKWEFGGGGGGSIYRSQAVSGSVADAKAGFDSNYAITGVLAHNNHKYLGGEIRYVYEKNDLMVSAGGAKATFGGSSQAIHYDVVIHATARGSKVRPFIAAGGGVKQYRGTGTEVVSQPLANVALLTKTNDTKALISVGAGVKFFVAKHLNLRIEFRDYITPFPKKVIVPVGNGKIDGWLHNFVPLFGLGIVW